jgi:hypothetical protein
VRWGRNKGYALMHFEKVVFPTKVLFSSGDQYPGSHQHRLLSIFSQTGDHEGGETPERERGS